jgi:hypothetical protein
MGRALLASGTTIVGLGAATMLVSSVSMGVAKVVVTENKVRRVWLCCCACTCCSSSSVTLLLSLAAAEKDGGLVWPLPRQQESVLRHMQW